MKNYLVVFLILSSILTTKKVSSQGGRSQNQSFSIIPQPASIKALHGHFTLSGETIIYFDKGSTELKKIAEMLASEIKSKTSFSLKVSEVKGSISKNSILFTLKNANDSLKTEGYSLHVSQNFITLRAKMGNGIFYGLQTLLQLLPVDRNVLSKPILNIPSVEIVDKPRFEWRGLMLDAGRYFYSMDFLKKYIDYLAMHKMNIFHWHLTEDHGWRLEIKKYPRLTEVAAWRESNQFDRTQLDMTPKGGYYTQEQAKELVSFAASRYVQIVPEIEMPGHSFSALVAYPELSCTGGPFKMLSTWGIQKDIYCAGNEKTFEFLENVLSEVVSIFPSAVIHIGGDEAPKDRWKSCEKCQRRIKEEHLKNEHELQSYFIKRIEKFLLTKNKTIIGWDEILEGGLAPNASVMSWRGTKGGIEAAKQFHNVIMSPSNYYYLDYYQGQPYLEPIAFNSGVVSLEKVYSFEPYSTELTSSEQQYIKGVQGNMWSEYTQSPEKVEYMTYPRAAAIAETGWSPANGKSWEDFKRRMENQYMRYELAGINYSKSAYNIVQENIIDSSSKTATIYLSTNSFNPEIHYTTDGNEPTMSSPVYKAPFSVKIPVLIKAATFKAGKRVSKINEEAVILKQ